MNSKAVFIVLCCISARAACAEDEKSIKELADALVALAPGVDRHEAEVLSVTAHTTSRALAREYGVTGDPAIHNYLIKIGARKRGICADYTRDIGTRLKEFHFRTLMLHWGAAWAKLADENNALVVTARNQSFQDGIILDGWRRAGRLFWCPVKDDHEYEVEHYTALNQLASRSHSGVTAWKEDFSEAAWLQENPPAKPPPKRRHKS